MHRNGLALFHKPCTISVMETTKLYRVRPRLKRLLRQRPVLLTYLFGSQATGKTHAESDVDVGVLFEHSLTPEERFAERLTLIGALSRLFGTDHVDVVVLNESPPLVAYEALRNGVLLYCADEEARVEFQVSTMRKYEDTAPLRRILSEALAARLETGTFGEPVMRRDRSPRSDP